MDRLSSHRTSSSGCEEAPSEASSHRTAHTPVAASRQEICDALSEMRSLRPVCPQPAGAAEWACAGATAGDSDEIQLLRSQIQRIAPYFRTALITGIEGTGKEGVARLLHAMSPSADGEFIVHEAASLAEAMNREDGGSVGNAAMISNSGGTLYLNEIDEVPLAMQGALLRLWSNPSRNRMRLIAGTHRDLRTLGVTGQFRQDLAQRLTGIELSIPPLRTRRDDLPAVIEEVLRATGGERNLRLSSDANARLLAHGWAGDVAELNEVLRAAADTAGRRSLIEASYLPELRAEEPGSSDIRMEKLQDVVRQHVLTVLTRCGGNKLRAAEILGISRSTLYRMLDTCVGNDFAVSGS